MGKRRGFGAIRRLPSGRYQASYVGPDGKRRPAGTTFQTRIDAEGWLHARRNEITDGQWTPGTRAKRPAAGTLGEFAQTWLDARTSGRLGSRPLKPTTRVSYEDLLTRQLAPLAHLPVTALTPDVVEDWYDGLNPATPVLRARAYGLLRTLCGHAVARRILTVNPCQIRGAATAGRATTTEPATLDELGAIATEMPPRLRLLVLLCAWCALRFGEATELRRKDLNMVRGVIHVRRGVVTVRGVRVVQSTPKSDAGIRKVHIPPHLLPAVRDHLAEHVGPGPEALLFPGPDGQNLPRGSVMWHFERARAAVGRPDLRFHDLRHTGAVLAAATGATLAELMARLGHSTPAAAMRYQHAARDADSRIARALSTLAEETERG